MNINELYKSGLLKEIINTIEIGEDPDDLQDFEQDVYLQLLTKDTEKIQDMSDDDLRFYLTRICLNNIKSKTSKYYYQYKKHKEKTISLNEYFNL